MPAAGSADIVLILLELAGAVMVMVSSIATLRRRRLSSMELDEEVF